MIRQGCLCVSLESVGRSDAGPTSTFFIGSRTMILNETYHPQPRSKPDIQQHHPKPYMPQQDYTQIQLYQVESRITF